MTIGRWLSGLVRAFWEGWSVDFRPSEVPALAEASAPAELRIDGKSAYAIYPFLHVLEGRDRAERLKQLSARWRHAWLRLDDQALCMAWEDTYFLNPSLRRVLFPETELLPDKPVQLGLEHLDALRKELNQPLEQLDQRLRLPDESIRRLTLKPEEFRRLETEALIPLDHEGKPLDPFPMRIEHVEVWLFPQRMGLLILKLRLEQERLTVERFGDWLWYLRQVQPRTVTSRLPRWRVGAEGRELDARALIEELLRGLAMTDTPDGAYMDTTYAQTYGFNFNLYGFACLDEASSELGSAPDPLFGTRFRRVLSELATCTSTSLPAYVPSEEVVQTFCERHWIALWECWEALALADNVFYLGKRPLRFITETLSRNVENDYLHLYLLTLYQKMRLRLLTNVLQMFQTQAHSPLSEAKRLRREFVEFRNHYWFHEASIRPQGYSLYRCYQDGQEIPALYEEMKTELDEIEKYYRERSGERIEKAVTFLTMLVPLGILSQLFASALHFPDPMEVSLTWAIGITVLVVIGTGVFYWWLYRSHG